jgi:O-antigen/teichoic acid export membrane protein
MSYCFSWGSSQLLCKLVGGGPPGEGKPHLAPLGLAPIVLSFGLQFYAFRAASQGKSIGSLLGTIGGLLVPLGLVGVAMGPFVGDLVGGSHEIVQTWVTVGFALLPLSLLILLVSDAVAGQERWGTVVAARLMPPVASLVGISGLYFAGQLTVGTAAFVSILGGALPAIFLMVIAREFRPLRFDRAMVREAIPFGLNAWAWSLGAVLNVRFDQVLMTRLVEPSELGLYAIAVTVAGFLVYSVGVAISSAAMPRFATGDIRLVARVLRMTLFGGLIASGAIALATPIVMPTVFGPDFKPAVPMVWILLLAGFPLVGTAVASTAMVGFGRPGYAACSELVALGVTVPALFWLAPSMGGIGAALVSLLAYSASFGMLLIIIRRQYGTRLSELLLIRPADVGALAAMAKERVPDWLPRPDWLRAGTWRNP